MPTAYVPGATPPDLLTDDQILNELAAFLLSSDDLWIEDPARFVALRERAQARGLA